MDGRSVKIGVVEGPVAVSVREGVAEDSSVELKLITGADVVEAVCVAVAVNVGLGVDVADGIRVGVREGVDVCVSVGNEVRVNVARGVRVGVEEGVSVGVGEAVGVEEAVGVVVFVRVGVYDNARISSCAWRVCAARVASAFKSWVADGIEVRVMDGVAAGGRVRVGEESGIGVLCFVAVTETGSGVV